jgi:hypothetical protein
VEAIVADRDVLSYFVSKRRWSGGYDISLVLVFAGSQAEQAMSKVEKEKIKRE